MTENDHADPPPRGVVTQELSAVMAMDDTTFGPPPPASELARQLVMHLGTTVVAAVAGAHDRRLPGQWSIAGGASPEPAALTRLQAAHQIWATIASAAGPDIARAWFLGANPCLDERPPYLAIRAGHFDEVRAAAMAFVEGRSV